MGLRESPWLRCEKHLQWVRGCRCVVAEKLGTDRHCEGKVRACHVRTGTDGALGEKPSDNFVFPACDGHHGEQHNIGEERFEAKYGISLLALAAQHWRESPHGKKWRMEQ